VNTNDFFRPLTELLDRCIAERFMGERHRAMWQVVQEPEQVLPAILEAPAWSEEARGFAVS
jgi:predicted Rossmann-fold nucleotide-binding protein